MRTKLFSFFNPVVIVRSDFKATVLMSGSSTNMADILSGYLNIYCLRIRK